MIERAGLPTLLIRSAIIAICSAGVGLAHNALSDDGIPLRTPATSRPETAIQWSLHLEGIRTTLEEAKRDYDAGAIFVDARSLPAYARGHIPGARHLQVYGFDRQFPKVLENMPKDARIVAYCSGGSCQSSTKLSRLLVEAGYTNVGCFYSGWQAWREAGFPVESGAPEGG